MPMISPLELIEHAVIRNNGESAGMSVLRSVIVWFCRRNARGLKLASSDTPTTSPASLMPLAELWASPGGRRGHVYLSPCSTGRHESTRRLSRLNYQLP